MGERERQLCVVCKVYEKLLQEAGLFEKASNKAFRALQIRDVVNCKDENFKAFISRIAQIEPEEYVEYYENFELTDEKEARFNDALEEPEEPDCENCVYFNDEDDCCENVELDCNYIKKTEE